MILTIGEKEYELRFGIEFIKRMDDAYKINAKGMEFGMGVESAVSYMAMENPTVLYEIIKAGTAHLNSKPSNKDVEAVLEKYAEEDKLDQLFKNIQEAMEVAPFLKQKIKKFKEEARVREDE